MSQECDNPTIKGCSEYIVAFVIGLLICFVIDVCVGCKPQKEIVSEVIEKPVIVTQEHTIESVKIDHVRDTLFQRDSIFHYVQGDTTIIERWHHTQGVTNIYKVDTLHIYDSVPYPVTTTQIKEVTKVQEVNRLKWWQKLFIAIGGIALIGLCLFGAYKIGKR